MYKKIGVAIAFSPRCEAIMGEASRLQKLFGAGLVLIHVGEVQPDEKTYMEELIEITGVNRDFHYDGDHTLSLCLLILYG